MSASTAFIGRSQAPQAAIAFLYEHPHWFDAIFRELRRREVPFDRCFVPEHFYDVNAPLPSIKLLFNRMSPSAASREHGSGIYHVLAYLQHLALGGMRVINGATAFGYEISKAAQASLLRSLGVRGIPTRVIHDPSQAPAAARGLRYPIVVKPNVGGSGQGVRRFDTPAALAAAVHDGQLDLGHDHVGLVQEFAPARGGFITRVETLGGRYLYAINVHLSGTTFDLCPADICQTATGQILDTACAVEAAKAGLKVEGVVPPRGVIDQIERIVHAAAIDVGGVEFLVDDRDGEINFYDINALSNFVADAPRVIGFDPVPRLADFLEAEVRHVG